MRGIHLRILAIGLNLCLGGLCAAEDSKETGYQVVRTMHVGGEGRWDYVAVDPVAKLLYVPRQTHTQVIREDTGEVVGDLRDTPGVHGVALVPEAGIGFTSNGKADSLTCFDLKTFKANNTLAAGNKPDAILYDPASKRVMAFNGGSNDATAAPAVLVREVGLTRRLGLGGKPEFAVADGNGRVYVNLEDKSRIAVIDSNSMKLVATWKIEGGKSPTGLAIDVAGHRLFSGCGNKVMAVVDTTTGKTLATVPIGEGVDACEFDPGTGEAFASCGDGTLTVIKETSPGKFAVTQTVHTRPGARTMGLDSATHTIYLPTAEFMAGESGKRPAAKPDSFMIVVVARQ